MEKKQEISWKENNGKRGEMEWKGRKKWDTNKKKSMKEKSEKKENITDEDKLK